MQRRNSVARFGAFVGSIASAMFGAHAHGQETNGDSSALEEVIVTAEKRATNLQKLPQAVTVLDSDRLAQASVTEVRALQNLVPNLTIKRSGSRNDYSIRGVSALVTLPADQPSTAMILDGIYSQAANAGAGAFLDVAQVEVLKGPQGTLFGRNATAGAIAVNSQRPKFENSAQLQADVGSYSKTNADGVMNFAVSEHVAIRAAAQLAKRDGYYDDEFDDEDSQSARLKVLFAPNEDLSLLLSSNYTRQRGTGTGSMPISNATGALYADDPWAGPTDSANQTSAFASFNGRYGADAQVANVNRGVNAELNWTLGAATLTTLTSYQEADRAEVTQDFSATSLNSIEKSFETRLASNDGSAAFKWLVGAYYYDQKLYGNAFGAVLGALPTSGSSVRSANPGGYDPSELIGGSAQTGIDTGTENYALFTQETFAVSDAVRLTAGLRWQHETAVRGSQTTIDYANGVATAPRDSIGGEASWSPVTYKAGIDVDVAEDSMAYLMVATGWKGGAPSQWLPPYDQQLPEKLRAYTLGIKNRFFEQRLQLNGEIFYWDYRDRQITFVADPVFDKNGVRQVLFGNFGALVSGNAVKSHIQGIDLDVAYLITNADTVTLNVEYLDEAVHDDIGLQVIPGCSADCRMTDAAKWSGTMSYRHVFDLGGSGQITFDLSSKLQTETQLALGTATAARTQGGYTMSNAGLRYAPEGATWHIRGYVDNIEDKLVKNSVTEPTGASYSLVTYMPPRTVGLQFRADF